MDSAVVWRTATTHTRKKDPRHVSTKARRWPSDHNLPLPTLVNPLLALPHLSRLCIEWESSKLPFDSWLRLQMREWDTLSESSERVPHKNRKDPSAAQFGPRVPFQWCIVLASRQTCHPTSANWDETASSIVPKPRVFGQVVWPIEPSPWSMAPPPRIDFGPGRLSLKLLCRHPSVRTQRFFEGPG